MRIVEAVRRSLLVKVVFKHNLEQAAVVACVPVWGKKVPGGKQAQSPELRALLPRSSWRTGGRQAVEGREMRTMGNDLEEVAVTSTSWSLVCHWGDKAFPFQIPGNLWSVLDMGVSSLNHIWKNHSGLWCGQWGQQWQGEEVHSLNNWHRRQRLDVGGGGGGDDDEKGSILNIYWR